MENGMAKSAAAKKVEKKEDKKIGLVNDDLATVEPIKKAKKVKAVEAVAPEPEAKERKVVVPKEKPVIAAIDDDAVVTVKEAEKIRDEARLAYSGFQKSWYTFAKLCAKVCDDKVWVALGYENFKAYCQEEFKDVGYPTIIKFVEVVHDWREDIEALLTDNPNRILPSYETCYTLTASEDRFPKGEAPKLRKKILEGAVTVRDIRGRVSELKTDSEKKRTDEFVGKLERDVEKAAPHIERMSTGSAVSDALGLITGKVDFLIENVPLVAELLKEGTDDLYALAEKIQDVLLPKINDFLDLVGEFSDDGEEG